MLYPITKPTISFTFPPFFFLGSSLPMYSSSLARLAMLCDMVPAVIDSGWAWRDWGFRFGFWGGKGGGGGGIRGDWVGGGERWLCGKWTYDEGG